MMDLRFSLPAPLDEHVLACLSDWETKGNVARMWAGDASMWTGADEARWLGWLHVIDGQLAQVDSYARSADRIRAEGFRRVLLLGMGGSSLAPEVFSRTFGLRAGFPSLRILDSTDPAQVRAAVADPELASTLVVVASKSGTTLEPNLLKDYFFERLRALVGAETGKHFIAITDPGSQLEEVASKDGFRQVFFGEPTIGGRFSALSSFGMVPAALAGVDVGRLLQRVGTMATRCGPEAPIEENPGAVLGAILGAAALAGRDKPTFIASAGVSALGAWLEQLLAESTGKGGKAIIPIDGEAPARSERYGEDRLFVHLRLRSSADAAQDRAVDALEGAGQPVVRIDIADRDELGAEFFRWEMATAVAGAIMRLNPFDQPDVESAKQITRRLAAEYESAGALPPEMPFFRDGQTALFADRPNAAELERLREAESGLETSHVSLDCWLRAHFARVRPHDYVALLAYIPMTAAHESALQRIRHRVRDIKKVATSVGFGPRYLHSTGQAHKGGPNTGVFLQITTDDAEDLPIPGHRYTFGVIKLAQARGDFQALSDRGRRALRVHLGPDVAAGLAMLEQAVATALR